METDAPLVLVACGSQKLDRAAPARDLYVGDLFKKARAYAESRGGGWLILSALHGVVEPDRVLEPYDRRTPTTKFGRREFAKQLARGLHAHRERQIVCLAGEDYCGWIAAFDRAGFVDGAWTVLHRNFPNVQRPLEGMGIGHQKSWLKAQLAA